MLNCFIMFSLFFIPSITDPKPTLQPQTYVPAQKPQRVKHEMFLSITGGDELTGDCPHPTITADPNATWGRQETQQTLMVPPHPADTQTAPASVTPTVTDDIH